MDDIDVIDYTLHREIELGDQFDNVISLLGDQGPTIEAICEDCEERQLVVEFGAACNECGSETLTPINGEYI